MVYGVLGAGSWGTAIARVLAERDEVYLWGRDEGHVQRMQLDRENEQYLESVRLPYDIRATFEFERVVNDSDVILVAVPSHAVTEVFDRLVGHLDSKQDVLTLAKGFDPDSGRRLSQEYKTRFETLDNYYLLSGPTHAQEVARQRPTSIVLGGGTQKGREHHQQELQRDYFRVYTNEDLVGMEMGGALKNIFAIASGISDGLGFGDNARAALITRGMNELRRLAQAEGAKPYTVYGLTGLGDLVVTATSELSRNYQLGQLLAEGYELREARDEINQVVEGVAATKIVYDRVIRKEVQAPIVMNVHRVLRGKLEPMEAVKRLMNRPSRSEFRAQETPWSEEDQEETD